MKLVAITRDFASYERIRESQFWQELCASTLAMYPNASPVLHCAGYQAEEEGTFVGTCEFKAPPNFG